MLHAGRSRILFPIRSLDFSINAMLKTALQSTQPLTEMSTKTLYGHEGQPALKADTSPPSVNCLSRKYGNLDVS
jgi:hypothetical protein